MRLSERSERYECYASLNNKITMNCRCFDLSWCKAKRQVCAFVSSPLLASRSPHRSEYGEDCVNQII